MLSARRQRELQGLLQDGSGMPTAILAHHVTSAVSVSVKEAERASNNLSLPMDKYAASPFASARSLVH